MNKYVPGGLYKPERSIEILAGDGEAVPESSKLSTEVLFEVCVCEGEAENWRNEKHTCGDEDDAVASRR